MATKEKALKKSKLRHAEYYDFQEIQDKLYAESKNGKIFNKLVEVIIQPENIRLAYRNMKKNDGSHTPGTDGKTIADLEKSLTRKSSLLYNENSHGTFRKVSAEWKSVRTTEKSVHWESLPSSTD